MRYDIQARLDATKKLYKIYADILEDTAATQFAECMEQPSVIQGALMPDAHAGYVAPIGSVLAVKDSIFPSFVGYDIGCGMSAIRTNIHKDSVTKEQLEDIKTQILRDIPIGFKRQTAKQKLPKSLILPITDFAREVLHDIGVYQLGTLGGGNHFLEIGYDNSDFINIVIHSGSRGVGHKIATHYMKEAAIQSIDEQRYADEFDKKNGEWHRVASAGPLRNGKMDKYHAAKKEFIYRRTRARVDNIEDAYPLDVNSQTGMNYINDMNMALEFALANRKQMIDKCVYALNRILDSECTTSRFINRNHNHADLKDGLWIHRKGATHAAEDMLGVIPGNMVDGSFIVKGKGSTDSMNSSSHGAGRVLSRRKAKETLDLKEFQTATEHLVANHDDSNLDEAPLAYKSIFEVMELQSDLVEKLDRIVPILNIKG